VDLDQPAQVPQRGQPDAGASLVPQSGTRLLVQHPCRQAAMGAIRQRHHNTLRQTGRKPPQNRQFVAEERMMPIPDAAKRRDMSSV
jgi:hypothetical protein